MTARVATALVCLLAATFLAACAAKPVKPRVVAERITVRDRAGDAPSDLDQMRDAVRRLRQRARAPRRAPAPRVEEPRVIGTTGTTETSPAREEESAAPAPPAPGGGGPLAPPVAAGDVRSAPDARGVPTVLWIAGAALAAAAALWLLRLRHT